MSQNPSRNRTHDRSAAVTLEVPGGVADDIEAVLRRFAREADLDTSLVVDHSGFLVAGISSLPEMDVDAIGALVASASGTAEVLSESLGEEGRIESFHLGEDRLLYLREVGERFILVGVSDANVPSGILRDQSSEIEGDLLKLLSRVRALPISLTKKKGLEKTSVQEPQPDPPRSLRPSVPPPALVSPPQSIPDPVTSHNGWSSDPGPKRTSLPSAQPQPSRPRAVSANIQLTGVPPSAKLDPIPPVFEVDEETPESMDFSSGAAPASTAPIESKRPAPRAVVEYSPFEVDEEEEEVPFRPVRPNTTPVHISVPAARQREEEARGKRSPGEEEEDSGPRYSFELG